MRIVIVGAVAAGTSAAAKARRNDEMAEIVVYERDYDISYSSCGMPYYIGGEVKAVEELTPRDPLFFKRKYNVDICTRHEVLSIDSEGKQLRVKNLSTGEIFTDRYDRLILATGATPIIPTIKGSMEEHVFTLRNIGDVTRIKSFVARIHPKQAVVVGSGLIGLELCENLRMLGLDVSLLEKASQVMPSLDEDMAIYIEEHLKSQGIGILCNALVVEITNDSVILSDGRRFPADLVILSTGVRPNVTLAQSAGVELGTTGAIRVNSRMQTSVDDIYACGDCIELFDVITRKPVYRPMGSTANKTGRIAGDVVTGGRLEFRGVLGTAIVRVFGMTVAHTGLTEREAKTEGFDVVVCHSIKPNKPVYLGGKEMTIKGVADRATGRLLGVQIVGSEGVDKRVDVFATAITYGAHVEDLFHLDLAYAPPFSTTKDPVMYTGMILDNVIHGERPLITAKELYNVIHSNEPYQLIDTRDVIPSLATTIESALHIPHTKLRDCMEQLDRNRKTITFCNKGVTGNATQNILLNNGFRDVSNLSGGQKQYHKIVRSANFAKRDE